MNASLSHDLVRRSVFEAIVASTDDYPYHVAMRAVAVLERVEDRMPALFKYVSANEDAHLRPFMNLVASLPRLPSASNTQASDREVREWVKEMNRWMAEMAAEAHRTVPPPEYCTCAQTLLQKVFCFGKDDFAVLDIGFYKAMMAFVRPMRDTITHYNLTH
jgi:hypothetical protein